ncbi:uncharacterized protein [Diadema setosum]|uniref:uncharacterized protein n=1 Tax=Diadema setosum TaxID=31175 RepID=UPI003B3A313A
MAHSLTQCLLCTFCHDVYHEASLLICGHTFCLRCLQGYLKSSSRWSSLECPICRIVTILPENRVDNLPRNFVVNAVIDHFKIIGRCGRARRGTPPTCTSCDDDVRAEAFCSDCDIFMCEACESSHRQLKCFFETHNVLSAADALNYHVRPQSGSQADVGGSSRSGETTHGSNDNMLSSTRMSHPRNEVAILREVDLPHVAAGMATLSPDSVVIGYGRRKPGVHSFSMSGIKADFLGEAVGGIYDIECLSSGHFVISAAGNNMRVYNGDSTLTHQQFRREDTLEGYYSRLCRDQDNNIYAVDSSRKINVYDFTGERPQKVLPSDVIRPRQISVTKTGIIIACTCDIVPSTVAVFDAQGYLGSTLQSTGYPEYLYATVDSEDRVLVARVTSRVLRLSLFVLAGTRLEQVKEFEDVRLEGIHPSWCYMTCLSRNVIAFASSRLYFIELPT